MTNTTTAALIAADYIRSIDPTLAGIFLARPFNRVALAQAFAKGLRNDPMQMGLTIIDLAEIDRAERMESYEGAV